MYFIFLNYIKMPMLDWTGPNGQWAKTWFGQWNCQTVDVNNSKSNYRWLFRWFRWFWKGLGQWNWRWRGLWRKRWFNK